MSNQIKKQIDDINAILALTRDNPSLQVQLNRRIGSLTNTFVVVKAAEDRDADQLAETLRYEDELNPKTKKIKDVVDDLGSTLDADGKLKLKEQIEQAANGNDVILEQYRYMKQKGLTKKQIRLVMGL